MEDEVRDRVYTVVKIIFFLKKQKRILTGSPCKGADKQQEQEETGRSKWVRVIVEQRWARMASTRPHALPCSRGIGVEGPVGRAPHLSSATVDQQDKQDTIRHQLQNPTAAAMPPLRPGD